MKKIDLSAYRPITDIQDNIIFANNGNVVLCYEGILPEIYSYPKRISRTYMGLGFKH